MPVSFTTPGIHHITLRASDLIRSKDFYQRILGFQVILDTEDLFIFAAGSTFIAFRQAETQSPEDKFNPFNIGLDHLALACEDEAELDRATAALAAANIDNTGVKIDSTLGKKYVSFKDPDRINWEFYMV